MKYVNSLYLPSTPFAYLVSYKPTNDVTSHLLTRVRLFQLASVAFAAPNQPNDIDTPDASSGDRFSRDGKRIKMFGQTAGVPSGWKAEKKEGEDSKAAGRERVSVWERLVGK